MDNARSKKFFDRSETSAEDVYLKSGRTPGKLYLSVSADSGGCLHVFEKPDGVSDE